MQTDGSLPLQSFPIEKAVCDFPRHYTSEVILGMKTLKGRDIIDNGITKKYAYTLQLIKESIRLIY